MKYIDIEEIKEKDHHVIHCTNAEEIKRITGIMNSLGWKTTAGGSYREDVWNSYNYNVVFYPCEGEYSTINYYYSSRTWFTIIPSEQVVRMYDVKELTEKDAVVVNTDQESIALRQLMHNAGMKWYTEASYLDNTIIINPVAFIPTIGGYLRCKSSLKGYNNIQIYQIKGIEKYLKMEEKQLIGYKIKEQFLESLKALFRIHSWNKNLTTHFSKDSEVYRIIVELKTLDAWCIPVYKKEYKLPTLFGYDGEIVGDTIKYGCAELNIEWFKTNSSRAISTFTLNSGKTIASVHVEEIRVYLKENNLI